MNCSKIKSITAMEILDSRGNPTVEAAVILDNGMCARASVPSGASTGKYEALELRDGDSSRYGGKGVIKAVKNIENIIAPALRDTAASLHAVDERLIKLDGTEDKSNLGANATLAVSIACAKVCAASVGLPLYRYIGGTAATRLPVPMMNILNGGAHSSNNLDVQEFMIVPVGFNRFSDGLRAGAEVYRALGTILKKDGKSIAVGDEGGYAPDLRGDTEALDYICAAIQSAGYTLDNMRIALDTAAGEWYDGKKYTQPKSGRAFTSDELTAYYGELCDRYPIISVEDPLGEDDTEGWKRLTKVLGDKIRIVGDDFFVTNTARLRKGMEEKCANSILIKPNQIGTLSEALEVMRLAADGGYTSIASHRSGETEEYFIADIAVAAGARYIKAGAPCRGERTAKYNRLLRIEAWLGAASLYGEDDTFSSRHAFGAKGKAVLL
jgi:enolase